MKKIIATTHAPGAIGPYSQGVRMKDLIMTSGQLPIDPVSETIPDGIEAQTRQSLKNIEAVLAAECSGMDMVIKTTVFLKDMNDFASMNTVYGEFFSEGNYPARSAVQVAKLPKDALIEIEAIAFVKD